MSEHLTYYMARMQAAGYDKSFRAQVLKSAFAAHRKMEEDERNGMRPMYRAWKSNERRKEKLKKAKNWYKTGGNE